MTIAERPKGTLNLRRNLRSSEASAPSTPPRPDWLRPTSLLALPRSMMPISQAGGVSDLVVASP